jgi:acetyl esterase/lipase
MKRIAIVGVVAWAVLAGAAARAADEAPYTRTEDVVYGHKDGMALTMDVLTPKKDPNGAAFIWAVSGGWFSKHDAINPAFLAELPRRGYTVFAVEHGSQPRYTIPEILDDMNRAVRFIRSHARVYHIDPDRIGMAGGSAGGHLSLMQGVSGAPGDPKAKDPLDRESTRVQAVACFFPPTDFLNYGEPGNVALGGGILVAFKAAFAFHDIDPKTQALVPVTDVARILDIGKKISPIYHVSADTPPTLIIHGDADRIVPIQQAKTFIEKLKAADVPADLVVKKGADHGWGDIGNDMTTIADWFDKYLGRKAEDKGK